jgi:regulator of sigma E protease
MTIVLFIFGLMMFVGLVIIHELGHFWAARRSGVEVEEFGLGFPPRAKKLGKRNGTLYSLNWLPLGGFVRLKGEHDDDRTANSFGSASTKNKVKIMVAGVIMNLVGALALLTVVAWIGMPQIVPDQFTVPSDSKTIRSDVIVAGTEEGSPADRAGLKRGDIIEEVGFANSCSFSDCSQAKQLTRANDLKPVVEELVLAGSGALSIKIIRDGQPLTIEATPRSRQEVAASQNTDNPIGYLGIAPSEYIVKKSTWSAPVVAVGTAAQITVATLKGLGTALLSLLVGDTSTASSQVSGPVGIFYILFDGSRLGFSFVLMIIAIISLTLAIMNILPIPALDGGRLFLTLLYRIMHRPLNAATEDKIHFTGFATLMLLILVITWVDIKRFFL